MSFRTSVLICCWVDCVLCCAPQDMSLKCNEEGKSLSTETFAKVSLTNLRRQAVPDLSSDLGMNIFKKVDIFKKKKKKAKALYRSQLG